MENEQNKAIKFLDIEIHWKNTELQFSIHMKPTETDIIILNSSSHSHEHKLVGINYLINRVHTYPISKEAKDSEMTTIRSTLHNNAYKTKTDKQPTQKTKQETHIATQQKTNGPYLHTVEKRYKELQNYFKTQK
jgi:hypothetical protein